MKAKFFFISVLLSCLWLSCTDTDASSSRSPQYPNIVFILADDLGYGDVSCYNPESKIQTPHIDQLAEKGIRFTDAHSSAAVCTPSRYSILTGRYPWRSRLPQGITRQYQESMIEPNRLTLGDMLKRAGYSTACIGKWHLGMRWQTTDGSRMPIEYANLSYQEYLKKKDEFEKKVDFTEPILEGPIDRGFEYYFGDDVPNFPPYVFIENDRAMSIPGIMKPDSVYGNPGLFTEGWDLTKVMPAILDKGRAYIQGAEPVFQRDDKKPFFLYLPLTAPHTPIAPTAEYSGRSQAGRYGDYVAQVDGLVGGIVEALESEGLLENTIIVFTSDNGSPARDGKNMSGSIRSVLKHGHNPSHIYRGIKAGIYEGGHRVPLIVQWPGVTQAGSVADETVCLVDFMATFADLIGFKLPRSAAGDSYSLMPLLKSESYEKPLREATIHQSGNGLIAIRQGKWKLILGGGSGGWIEPRNDQEARGMGLPLMQLYDLTQSPDEQINLHKDHPEVVKRLTGLFEKYKEEGRSVYEL